MGGPLGSATVHATRSTPCFEIVGLGKAGSAVLDTTAYTVAQTSCPFVSIADGRSG